jgi:hypothetical protein
MKPKPMKGKYWAYFAPDGYLQVRSIARSITESREMIAIHTDKTWKDYEEAGFKLLKIEMSAKVME